MRWVDPSDIEFLDPRYKGVRIYEGVKRRFVGQRPMSLRHVFDQHQRMKLAVFRAGDPAHPSDSDLLQRAAFPEMLLNPTRPPAPTSPSQ